MRDFNKKTPFNIIKKVKVGNNKNIDYKNKDK